MAHAHADILPIHTRHCRGDALGSEVDVHVSPKAGRARLAASDSCGTGPQELR